MPVRKAYAAWSWLTIYEVWLGTIGGTPTSDGTGSCSFDFGVDQIVGNWRGQAGAGSSTYSTFGLNSVTVTDHASWADGTTRRILMWAGISIYAKKSGSQYVLEVSDGATTVTGTTLLSFGTAYHFSGTCTFGSPYRRRVFVGGTLEIDGNFTATGSQGATLTLGTVSGTANGSFSVREAYAAFTDTEERIDASSLNGLELSLNGDGASYNEYPQASPSGGAPSTPRSQYVVEDPPDDDTTWIQSSAAINTIDRQCYATDSITLANVEVVTFYTQYRATVTGKTLSYYAISSDGGTTNLEEVIISSIITTSYVSAAVIFERAPDGTTWAQADLDSWEPGTKTVRAGDIVALRDTAIHCEAMGCDYISLAAGGSRSRAFVF